MITHLFFAALGRLATWLIGLLPTWSLPSWVSDTASTVTGWLSGVGSLGYFVPLGPLAACMALIFAAFAIGFTIRVFRIGYSMFTGGGGAA